MECAAVVDPVTGGKCDFRIDDGLDLGDEVAEVAAADVGGDGDAALAVLAVDLIGAGGGFDAGEFTKRHKARKLYGC